MTFLLFCLFIWSSHGSERRLVWLEGVSGDEGTMQDWGPVEDLDFLLEVVTSDKLDDLGARDYHEPVHYFKQPSLKLFHMIYCNDGVMILCIWQKPRELCNTKCDPWYKLWVLLRQMYPYQLINWNRCSTPVQDVKYDGNHGGGGKMRLLCTSVQFFLKPKTAPRKSL